MADTDKLVKVGQLDTIVDEIVDKFGETNGRLTEQEEIVDRLNEGGLDIKDEVIEAQITDWLNDHPEATTTVQDGAISEAKLVPSLQSKIATQSGALLCVSTYRNDVRDDAYDYYLAISLDGGVTWSEIKESKNFANAPIGSDVQVFPYDGGFLFLATGANLSALRDFHAYYTKDFVTYKKLSTNLGFITKSHEYIENDAYVWAPNISDIDGTLYITCGVGYRATETESAVYGATGPGGQRYLRLFSIPVTININESSISAVDSMFELSFDNTAQSVMDASLVKHDGYIYCIYKDRMYNVVNISKASSIRDTFVDVIQVCGNDAYNEAGYLLEVNGTLCAVWASYYPKQYNEIGYIINDNIEGITEFGCVNTKYPQSGMRNPYPCVIDANTVYQLIKIYGIKKVPLGRYKNTRKTLEISSKAYEYSSVLYSGYNTYVALNRNIYFGITNSGQSGDIYIDNADFLVIRLFPNSSIIIHTPNFNATIRNQNNSNKYVCCVRGLVFPIFQDLTI